MEEIPNLVKQVDKEKELYCLWTNEGYDIGNKSMTKGLGIVNLAKYFKIDPKQIITTGNNYNDAEMIKFGKGITVEPNRVQAEYFIDHKQGELGGELLAEFLLKFYKQYR
jgi:hydroxymethylpyrimidine pyrophosphatase-like HAD family hydrolase